MIRLFISLFALALSCSASAQDTFYYSGGKKIELTKTAPSNSEIQKNIANSNYECYTDKYGSELYTTGYIYVKLKSLSDSSLLKDVASKNDMTIFRQNKYMPLWYSLHTSENKAALTVSIANSLYETGLFAECTPDFAMEGKEISYDTDVHKQWGLHNASNKGVDISVSEAWNYATGRNVVIAIIDEGIDLEHKDLAENIYEKSYDALTDSKKSRLYGNHGTHCAGIAAAVRNNGLGITGVAPDAKLMSVSFKFGEKRGNEFISNAINWAWMNGADIISCSWRCAENSLVSEAIESALKNGRNRKGCIVVKSAGNGYGNKYFPITFPGNNKGVITVGNIERDGKINKNSNRGNNLLVVAPGTDILSTKPDNQYKYDYGTSMAAPHVSGVAALMLEQNPNLTYDEVKEIIAITAKRLDTMPVGEKRQWGYWDEAYGYGLLNACDAVKEAINRK